LIIDCLIFISALAAPPASSIYTLSLHDALPIYGFAQMGEWLEKHAGPEAWIVMEATGIYHEALATWLFEQGYHVSVVNPAQTARSEEHTSELHHVKISYAVFCLKKKKKKRARKE